MNGNTSIKVVTVPPLLKVVDFDALFSTMSLIVKLKLALKLRQCLAHDVFYRKEKFVQRFIWMIFALFMATDALKSSYRQ